MNFSINHFSTTVSNLETFRQHENELLRSYFSQIKPLLNTLYAKKIAKDMYPESTFFFPNYKHNVLMFS